MLTAIQTAEDALLKELFESHEIGGNVCSLGDLTDCYEKMENKESGAAVALQRIIKKITDKPNDPQLLFGREYERIMNP